MKEKEKTEYRLKFVNKNKPFVLSNWTVVKHKDVLRETKEWEDKIKDEKKLDEKYQYILILRGLHEIDPNVTEDDLNNLHPNDLLELFAAVYGEGRKGIVDKPDFQKGKKTPMNLKK